MIDTKDIDFCLVTVCSVFVIVLQSVSLEEIDKRNSIDLTLPSQLINFSHFFQFLFEFLSLTKLRIIR